MSITGLSGDPLASQEFPDNSGSQQIWKQLEVTRRIGRIAMNNLFEFDNLVGISIATSSVWLTGLYEAKLLHSPDVKFNWKFATRYANAQLLPSVIWATKPAEVVLRAMGVPTRSVLRAKFPAPGTGDETMRQAMKKASARAEMRVLGAFTLRSVIAGFFGIAQILRLVDSSVDAGNAYRASVRRGRQPFLPGTKERVVRLGGLSSDVTDLSMHRYGEHIVPVFENPKDASTKSLVSLHSQGNSRPVFWHVTSNSYGDRLQWTGFKPRPEWLIPSSNGKKYLVVEADSTVGDESLALGDESVSDLTIQEASQAFCMIESLARENGCLSGDRSEIVRVLLADPNSPLPTGDGGSYLLKDHIKETREVDILINAQQPLINAVMKWTEALGADKVLIFDTGNHLYFKRVQALLKRSGIRVIDRSDKLARQKWRELPRLVYHDTTADTVNTMRSLIVNAKIPPERLCALLDRATGTEELKAFGGLSICSAVVYDALLAFVRSELRKGTPIDEIQVKVDTMTLDPKITSLR